MRLPTKTRYGVRALFDIAFHGDAGGKAQAIQAKDIARRQALPLRYLEQIFQDLRRAGLVDSRRGPRGGYTLKRAPEQITLSDLVTALHGSVEDQLLCADDDASEEDAACSVVTTTLWKGLAEHLGSWLCGVTLADLVSRANELGMAKNQGQPMYFI